MKTFEVLKSDSNITEEKLISMMINFDWNYEFTDNLGYIERKNKELNFIENAIYKIWKQDKNHALQIWRTHAKGSTCEIPSFIFRLDAQENVSTRSIK